MVSLSDLANYEVVLSNGVEDEKRDERWTSQSSVFTRAR
jgi:hypothetical protein